ncbi:nucleoside-specific channel-forming Tsx family protein [Vibrio algicola]|uniref:Outer membrane protein OmpK n=1 Tax=Vibrio algicola TaxID=2662262 RepID=A0A5Q0TE99_9VIBR|nr:outer membrane protein OmpK [Vibrio algicola]
MRKTLLALSLVAAAAPALAADYSDNIHKNDYKFLNFNLMYALNEKPQPSDAGNTGHDYLEMEYGGRSGIFDLYGYVDVFNLASGHGSDNDKDGQEKIFMKFAPRVSLDALTGKDLSFGPVQELYFATLMEWGGGGSTYTDSNGVDELGGKPGVNTQKVGLGSDVNVPWFGKMGLNLYATYDSNLKDWNGYQISTNWFKPFYTFSNDSFISYQGYIDYQFGMKDEYATSSNGGAMFNGIYWHSQHYAIGYGLKLYHNIYGIKDTSSFESSGVAHYFDVTYKF